LFSLQSIPAGAQVYDSYGQKCNHRFLLNYGFAVEDNRELDGFCPNEVPLELELSSRDPFFERKLEFWSRGESAHDPTKRVRVCVSNNENTRLLFSLLRTMAGNEEELLAVSNSMDGAAVSRALFGMGDRNASTFYRSCRDIRHPLSLRNEKAAMQQLLAIVDETLSKYPTTLSQDMADLMDEAAYPRFSNRRHAKIQVRGEKEVLHHFRHWATAALDVMDVMEHEFTDENEPQRTFEHVIREMEEEEGGVAGPHHTIVRYCADVLGSLRREEMKDIRRKAAALKKTGY
jgi:histone-lysine N-methyltransferase SETD3